MIRRLFVQQKKFNLIIGNGIAHPLQVTRCRLNVLHDQDLEAPYDIEHVLGDGIVFGRFAQGVRYQIQGAFRIGFSHISRCVL